MVRVFANADRNFAIVVAKDLGAAKALFKGEREQLVGEAFSGWKTVSYGETAHLSAFAGERIGVWQNVYLSKCIIADRAVQCIRKVVIQYIRVRINYKFEIWWYTEPIKDYIE